MAREIVNDQDLSKVAGGSIVFNADCSTCGRNRFDQYAVLNLDEVISYIDSNKRRMSEKQMLSNMVDLGYLSPL